MLNSCTYLSNEVECFSFKGGCGICVSRCLKGELAWSTDNWNWSIKYIVNYSAKELKNKVTINLK